MDFGESKEDGLALFTRRKEPKGSRQVMYGSRMQFINNHVDIRGHSTNTQSGAYQLAPPREFMTRTEMAKQRNRERRDKRVADGQVGVRESGARAARASRPPRGDAGGGYRPAACARLLLSPRRRPARSWTPK